MTPSDEPEKERGAEESRRTGGLIFILILNFLVGCTLFIQVSALPVYILELGGSKSTVGLIMGLFSLSALLTRPLAGILLDHRGRSPILLGGSLLLALSLLLYVPVRTLPLLMVIRVINGFAFSLVSTTAITLVVDITGEPLLKRSIGYFAVAGTLASAAGPALGIALLERGGFPLLFPSLFVLGIFICLISLILVRRIKPVLRGTVKSDGSSGGGSPIRLPHFLPSLFILFLGLSLGLILTYIPVLGFERNIPRISLFFSFYALAIVLLRLFGSSFLDRIGAFPLYGTAVLFQAGALFLLGSSGSLLPILAAALFYGSAFAMLQPLLNYMQIRVMPSDRKGLGGALYFVALDTGFSTGSMGSGFLLERMGFFPVFALCGLIVLLSVPLFKFLVRE